MASFFSAYTTCFFSKNLYCETLEKLSLPSRIVQFSFMRRGTLTQSHTIWQRARQTSSFFTEQVHCPVFPIYIFYNEQVNK